MPAGCKLGIIASTPNIDHIDALYILDGKNINTGPLSWSTGSDLGAPTITWNLVGSEPNDPVILPGGGLNVYKTGSKGLEADGSDFFLPTNMTGKSRSWIILFKEDVVGETAMSHIFNMGTGSEPGISYLRNSNANNNRYLQHHIYGNLFQFHHNQYDHRGKVIADVWTITESSTTVRVYANGSYSGYSSTINTTPVTTNTAVRLLYNQSGTSGGVDGSLFGVRIYDIILTNTQIQSELNLMHSYYGV